MANSLDLRRGTVAFADMAALNGGGRPAALRAIAWESALDDEARTERSRDNAMNPEFLTSLGKVLPESEQAAPEAAARTRAPQYSLREPASKALVALGFVAVGLMMRWRASGTVLGGLTGKA